MSGRKQAVVTLRLVARPAKPLDDLRRLLPVRAFRRLLLVRLFSQAGDGVLQVALASYLFFSPERQTTAGAIAAVTAATLVPFTIVGPFTGVVLDRWPRRDVLVSASVARTALALALAAVLAVGAPDAVLYVLVVTGFGINRFVLAGLSAALPHTVDGDLLLDANAVVPTAGTVAYVAGLGIGGVSQAVLGDPGVVGLAATLWAAAAGTGCLLARAALGPDREPGLSDDGDPRVGPGAEPGAGRVAAPAAALSAVVAGLRAAGAHLAGRPTAGLAIAVVAAQRWCATLTLAAAVLLYRSSYADADDPQAGLAGLSVSVLAAGVGFVLAALVTPLLVDRWSTRVAVSAGLAVGAVAQAAFAVWLTEVALVVAAFSLSLGGQVVKICADTHVQRVVDDRFRGRVFVLYDMAFNTALVGATCVGALLLPPSGRAPGLMAVDAAVLAALAVGVAVNRRGVVLPRNR